MLFTKTELLAFAAQGETPCRRFIPKVPSAAELAAEMAAFANCDGGEVYVGVAEDGGLPGLSSEEATRVGRLVGAAAGRLVCDPLFVETTTVSLDDDLTVVVLRVPQGSQKPHFDGRGIIWVKDGPDRRPVASRAELFRLFLANGAERAEEAPTLAGMARLDVPRLRAFLQDVRRMDWPDSEEERIGTLVHLKLADGDGMLTLAGALFFAEHPEWLLPHCAVACFAAGGTGEPEIAGGPLAEAYGKSMAFIERALGNAGDGQEIPSSVFGELLVNALVHRDYLIDDVVRVSVFDDRVEISSPGHLPGDLRVENALCGVSLCRNPLLLSYAAKGLLPCSALGTGISHALDAWPDIDFVDDRKGARFTATVRRRVAG